MIGFNGAFGRKARKFAYRPRYYDEAQNGRAERKSGLKRECETYSRCGRLSAGEQKQYVPGEYVRANAGYVRRFQGRGRQERRQAKSLRRTIIFIALTAMVTWIILTL